MILLLIIIIVIIIIILTQLSHSFVKYSKINVRS